MNNSICHNCLAELILATTRTCIQWALSLLMLLAALIAGKSSSAAEYQYDSLNRLSRVNYDNGTSIAYTYDAAGNRLTLVAQSGVAPDRVAPVIHITQPTTERLYVTTAKSVTIGGTASDATGITTLSCTNATGAQSSVAGTTSWTAGPIALSYGVNRITVSASDPTGNKGQASLTAIVLSTELPYEAKWAVPMNTFGATVSATDPDGGVILADYFTGSIVAGGQTLTVEGTQPDFYIVKLNTNGQPAWVRQYGGTNEEQISSCVRHPAGGWVIGGQFKSNGVFGAQSAVSAGNRDAFMARLDDSGNVLWVRRGGGTKVDYGEKVAVDGVGNCYLIGEFTTSATFSGGSTTLTAIGTRFDIFVAKYTASGDFLWAKSAGGGDYDTVDTAAAETSGNLYVSGRFTTNATFGSYTLTVLGNPVSTDAYLVKFNPNGDVLWAKRFGEPAGGNSLEGINFISPTSVGDCYFGGYYEGPMLAEGITLPSSSADFGSFIGKVDNAGSLQWLTASMASSVLYSAFSDVNCGQVLQDGGLIVGGRFEGKLTLGSTTITNPTSSEQLYFAKYDNSGLPRWGVSADTSGYNLHYLGTTGVDRVRFTALFTQTVNLPGLSPILCTPNDTLLVEMGPPDASTLDTDKDGVNDWSEILTGSSWSDPNSLFTIDSVNPTEITNSGFIVTWSSSTGVFYNISRATNLAVANAFAPLKRDIPGLEGSTQYNDTNAPPSGPSFYRISVDY
jgi:YD repeat-containing protein